MKTLLLSAVMALVMTSDTAPVKAPPAPEKPPLTVLMHEDMDLSTVQTLICGWLPAENILVCMTPEQFGDETGKKFLMLTPTKTIDL